jgi:hypothetical protein
MALTITATPDRAAFAMALVVAGAGGAPVTITAEPNGRAPYTVRPIGNSVADPFTVRDHEAPFGIEIRYTATLGATSATVLAAPLEVAGCVLSDTLRPSSGIGVRLLADHPHDWEARSAWFDVIDRPDPLVTVSPMRYRSGEWQIYARGNSERAALLGVITPGSPVLLRSGVPAAIDDAYALPLSVSESPHLDARGGRVFTVRYQAVTRTLGPYVGRGDWTYANLAAYVATYADLLPAFATYRDLYAGPPTVPAEAAPGVWGVPC